MFCMIMLDCGNDVLWVQESVANDAVNNIVRISKHCNLLHIKIQWVSSTDETRSCDEEGESSDLIQNLEADVEHSSPDILKNLNG